MRSYSVLDCALNRLEDDFDNQWKFLAIGASMWEDIVPLTSHTRAFRCTVFRMLSRSQCLVTVKLRNLHKKPPFAAFATLRSDEDAAAYVGKPTCLWCNFGQGLIHSFRHDPLGIRHPLAQSRLRHKARLARVTTDRIEALRASFRRRTRIRSTQTHSQALNEASA